MLYDLSVRSIDQADLTLAQPAVSLTAASNGPATQVFVEHGRVRIGGPMARMQYLFEDRKMVVIDATTRTVHVLNHATLSQLKAHYNEAVAQLEAAADKAVAAERAAAQRKAADLRAASDRMWQPVTRDYHVTARIDSVDGRACRIWEEREGGSKRLELCIALTSALPGGVDILAGLKTLSQFREGANFALGVDFGLSDWWHDIESLGGVPLLIREFQYDSEVSETLLSNIRVGQPAAGRFDLPEGYPVVAGPDYTQWYMRIR